MRILLFTPYTLNIYGGFERIVETISTYLIQKGINFSIYKLAHDSELIPYKQDWVEPYRSLCKGVLRYRLKRKILKKLSIWRGDLEINTEGAEDEINELRKAHMVITISPSFVYPIFSFLRKIGSNAKIITWFHLPPSFEKRSRNFVKSFLKSVLFTLFRFHQRQLKYADFHLAISSGIALEIKRLDPKARVSVVYNPVLPDKTSNLKFIGPPKSGVIFAYVGRLEDWQKNLTFLLKGLSKLPFDWRLKVIGTGPDEKKVRILAKKLAMNDKIEWLGFSEKPFDLLMEEGVTALLLTSRFEGLPTVLIEAISRGIPVVASNCKTGPDDIVVNGVNGYLYQQGSVRDFVLKLTKVVSERSAVYKFDLMLKSIEKFRSEVVCESIYKELTSLFLGL